MVSETRPSKVGKWTEPALRVLRERYLTRRDGEVVETPEEMCWRVARRSRRARSGTGAARLRCGEIAAAFYDIMVDGAFLPNSPTLMNAGKGNGLQYSACYVLPVGDSMEEIFDSVKAAAIIHKSGGGTGIRLLTPSSEGRPGQVHGRPRLGPRLVPARVQQRHRGREAGGDPARRQHGHPARRSPRHPGVHRVQARRRDHQLQHLGGRHRCLHGRPQPRARSTISSTPTRRPWRVGCRRARSSRGSSARPGGRAIPAWSSSIGSTPALPTPRRTSGRSRRPTRAASSRSCPTRPATSAR